jgi:hypothetical protein
LLPRSRRWGLGSRWAVLLALALLLGGPTGVSAADATQIVLQEADVAPAFVLVTRGDTRDGPYRLTRTSYRQAGRQAGEIEPSGLLGVTSLAWVGRNEAEARQSFDEAVAHFLNGTDEVACEPVGEAVRAGVQAGPGPFDPATKVLVFLSHNAVGIVIGGTFDAAADVADLVPLARLMAERATR